jgi:hypothetical protein
MWSTVVTETKAGYHRSTSKLAFSKMNETRLGHSLGAAPHHLLASELASAQLTTWFPS